MLEDERTTELGRATLIEELRGAASTAVDTAIDRAFRNLDLGRVAPAGQTGPDPDPAPAPASWLVQLGQSLPDERTPQAGDVITQGPDGKWLVLPEDEVVARVQYAVQRQGVTGIAEKLDGIAGLGIPWGSILFGALPGAIAGELVDGFMPPRNAAQELNIGNVLIKGGIGVIGTPIMARFTGRTAGILFAGSIGTQILAEVLPLNKWVQQIVARVRGVAAAQGNRQEPLGLQAPQGQLPVAEPRVSNPIVDMLEATAVR